MKDVEGGVFYLVWTPSSKYPPSVQHESHDEAQCEAERLAAANPGKRFFVLKALCYLESAALRYVELQPQKKSSAPVHP